MFNKTAQLPLIAAIIVLTSSCSQSVSERSLVAPTLQLQQFFKGSGHAVGVMQDWRSKQILHFTADLCGEWQQQRGDLYEIFQFSDGRVDKRHWRLALLPNQQIRGEADDVVGFASGELAGNLMQWRYQLQVPQDDGTIELTVQDDLMLVTPTELINRATLSKFGVTVAELTLSIRQIDANATCSAFKQHYQQLIPHR